MRKFQLYFLALTLSVLLFACKKDQVQSPENNLSPSTSTEATALTYTGFPETFESGSKTAYADANVTLPSGSWDFNDALIGTLSTDHKDGSKAVRMENTGILTMNFDVTSGATQVTIAHAEYGSDASSTWALYSSTNSGSTWTKVGSTVTTSSTTLNTASFTVSFSANVRFQLRKLSGGRLNIDDFNIVTSGGGGSGPDNDNMGMGNPSNATTSVSVPNNYLMVKPQYDLAYNSSKGGANWVSWHLDLSNEGSTTRCDCFAADPTLPSGFFAASSTSYSGSGFDRGHQCPSEERTDNTTDNAATFLMTNMLPQAPNLNEVTWLGLEDYCNTLISSGNELYIIAGGYGSGGTGSNGGTTTTLDGGKINVPGHCWKIVVVLPIGTNDLSRVTTSTRVIAVSMPNTQTVNAHTWDYYRTTVDAIETSTGYDFLSNVPTSIQSVIESKVDNGPTK